MPWLEFSAVAFFPTADVSLSLSFRFSATRGNDFTRKMIQDGNK